MKRKLSFDEIDKIKSLDQMTLNRSKKASVFGIGVNDVDFAVKVDGKMCRQYNLWSKLLERCYDAKLHEKYPTYIDCSVSSEWIYFSNFLIWCNNQESYKMKDEKGNSFQIDKDVANKGNKIYSSKDCNFIPAAVNLLLIKSDSIRGDLPIGVCFHRQHRKYRSDIRVCGVKKTLGLFDTEIEAFLCYKTAKETECKRVAAIYKEVLSPLVYDALMNYTVSIDD